MQHPPCQCHILDPVENASGRPWRPKDYAVIPANFGRDRDLRWCPATSKEDHLHRARVTAARVQHGLMYALARVIADSDALDSTDAAVAERVAVSVDRIGRIRRGDLPMRTEELGLICATYSISVQRVIAMAGLQPADLVKRQPEPLPTLPPPRP